MLALISHLLSYDLFFYFSHRLMHSKEYWWIHEEHHNYVNPTWEDSHKAHILENSILTVGYCIPFLFGIWSPYEVLGSIIIITIRGWLRHDKRTEWVDGGHHLYHHKVYNKNYGEPWLDWIFGTLDYKHNMYYKIINSN